jgi:hypothetical protein
LISKKQAPNSWEKTYIWGAVLAVVIVSLLGFSIWKKKRIHVSPVRPNLIAAPLVKTAAPMPGEMTLAGTSLR